MKNWLIKLLGGYTAQEWREAAQGFANASRDRVGEINAFLQNQNKDILARLASREQEAQWLTQKNLELVTELSQYRTRHELYAALQTVIDSCKK